MEDTAIAIVVHFHIGVQQRGGLEFYNRTICAFCFHGETLFRLDIAHAFDVVRLIALQAQRLGVFSIHEFQREDAHADKIHGWRKRRVAGLEGR